jgi:DNA-binding NtrC family response regulator
VLLVEDEPLIAIDSEDTLRHLGVETVVWARNVVDGLAAIYANTFHAGLLDLRLGGETSIPLAQQLAAQGVPFGFMTGFEDRAIPAEFKDRPIVAKPYTPQQLGDLIARLVAPQAPGAGQP